MRAVVIESYGGPEVLQLREVPDPVPGPEEVVVRVVSSALNRADVLQRMGGYPGPTMAHEIPGLELAGRVESLGSRATRWQVGDHVLGIVGGGAHAELVVVHERQLAPVPEAIPLADAGAVPEVFLTAWDGMVVQGGLKPGGTVLVHAGASGVGTAAIQYAKAIGCRVVATASAGKLDACRELGADEAIDRTTDWSARVHDVDVVLDLVGGDNLAANAKVLRPKGSIVLVGLVGGATGSAPLGALLSKRLTLVGTVLRARPIEEKIAVTQGFEREVVPFLASGACRPVIDCRYPLAEIAEAHRRLESNATIGKVVLEVSGAG